MCAVGVTSRLRAQQSASGVVVDGADHLTLICETLETILRHGLKSTLLALTQHTHTTRTHASPHTTHTRTHTYTHTRTHTYTCRAQLLVWPQQTRLLVVDRTTTGLLLQSKVTHPHTLHYTLNYTPPTMQREPTPKRGGTRCNTVQEVSLGGWFRALFYKSSTQSQTNLSTNRAPRC